MGTQGAIVFIIRGRRYAINSDYDSYPTVRGQELVDFIVGLDEDQIDFMAERVSQITWYNHLYFQVWTVCGTTVEVRPEAKVLCTWDRQNALQSIYDGTKLHWEDSYDSRGYTNYVYYMNFDTRGFYFREGERLSRKEVRSCGSLRRDNAMEDWSAKYAGTGLDPGRRSVRIA